MKKILFSIAALAVALGFTACSNEDEALSVKGGKTTVLAMTETGTRTALADDGAGAYNVVWSSGDYIYDHANSAYFYIINTYAGSTTAKFNGSAVLPNSSFIFLHGVGDEWPTWPTYQTYKANTVSVFPMRAIGTSDASGNLKPLQFYNLGGVLHLNVKGTATIKGIKVSATEFISGAITDELLTSDAKEYTAGMSEITGVNFIELDCGSGVELDATDGTDFYIAVPANTYTGVQITLTDTDGNTCTKTFKGAGLKIERSKITKASFTATIAPAITGTAKRTGDIDVNWVQLWAGGPKFAEYNVGVTDGKAESYGGYFCWGSTIDQDEDALYWEGETLGDNDTATKLWGSKWRMPTEAELKALLNSDNCTCTWTDSPAGLLCKGIEGTVYASNSVFLPAAGYSEYGDVYEQGVHGLYWSSTPNNGHSACNLHFKSDGDQSVYFDERCYGYSVRAVLAE